MERRLTTKNMDSQLAAYLASVEEIGVDPAILRGVDLFVHLKRDPVLTGPYPPLYRDKVTLTALNSVSPFFTLGFTFRPEPH